MLVLNDSMFIDYEYPDYVLFNLYERSYSDKIKTRLWDKIELFKRFLAHSVSFNRVKEKEQLLLLLKKYDPKYPGIDQEADLEYYLKNWQERIKDRLSLHEANYAVNQVMEKKWQVDRSFWEFSIRLVGYFTLFLSLLVFYYRHNTRPAFFLSLLAGIILAIITGLAVASTRGEFETFITMMIIYFVIFSIIAFLGIHTHKRRTLSAISLNLAVTLLPFIPLMIVALYYDSLHKKYDRIYSYVQDSEIHYKMFGNERFHYMLAETGGFILLLILIPLVIGGLYRRWYALPED